MPFCCKKVQSHSKPIAPSKAFQSALEKTLAHHTYPLFDEGGRPGNLKCDLSLPVLAGGSDPASTWLVKNRPWHYLRVQKINEQKEKKIYQNWIERQYICNFASPSLFPFTSLVESRSQIHASFNVRPLCSVAVRCTFHAHFDVPMESLYSGS